MYDKFQKPNQIVLKKITSGNKPPVYKNSPSKIIDIKSLVKSRGQNDAR